MNSCSWFNGSRPFGGPCLRWNDIIRADLRHLNAEDNWCQKTQDRIAWWQEVEDAAQIINSEYETQEKKAKDEKKRRREERLAKEADALVCPEEGCTFVARNTSGLTNHCHQWHSLLHSVICPHCQESFTDRIHSLSIFSWPESTRLLSWDSNIAQVTPLVMLCMQTKHQVSGHR